MSDRSRNLYRGLLVPDGDISSLWAAETTVDEAGNRAGVPDTPSQTEAVLEASGHQIDTGDNRSLEIRTLRGGYPGPGEAGFGWRQTAGAAQDYRGWDVPNVISSWENVDYNSNAGFNLHPDLVNVTRTDGTDYMITCYEWISGTNRRVAIRKRSGDVWGAEGVVYIEGNSVSTRYLYPTLLVLPTGRLLLFYMVYNNTGAAATSSAQIQMKYSDDEGATWTTGGEYTLETPIETGDITPARLKCAYKDGQISLLMWARDSSTPRPDKIFQYASDDLGTSFILVHETDPVDVDHVAAQVDVTTAGGFFVVVWLRHIGGGVYQPVINRIGSAYEPINEATAALPFWFGSWGIETPVTFEVTGDLSIATDEDGGIYLYGTEQSVGIEGGVCVGFRSYDVGQTWVALGMGTAGVALYGRWWSADVPAAGDDSIYPFDYTMEFHRGRAVVVHRYVSDIGQLPVGQNSLAFFYLGGYSTVTLPGLELFKKDVLRAGLVVTWVPFAIPSNTDAWAVSTAGGGITQVIQSPGRLYLACPGGSELYYLVTPGQGLGNDQVYWEDGFLGRFTFEVNAAPSLQNMTARVYVTPGGGPGEFCELQILIRDNNIELIDGFTGAPLIAPIPNSVGQKRQIFWAIRGLINGQVTAGGECAVWIRDWTTNEDRVWTLVYQGAIGAGVGGTTSFVYWGDQDVGFSSDQYWDGFHVTYGHRGALPLTGNQIAQGQANPGELFPRNYAPTPLYVDSDVRVASVDGPTFEADNWAVNVRHLQGGENMIPSVSPSPAKLWRSQTAPAGASIAFQRNPDTQDAWAGNDFYAIHFENVNFKRAALEYRIGGAWVPVTTIQLFRVFNFSRNGHTIRPLGGDSGGFYAYYNEFKGLKFEFNPDGQSSEVATISRNSEGVAYTGTNAKPATIFLDPETFDHTTAPASGVAHVWFRNITVLVPRSEIPFEGIRLNLCPTGTRPPEGYYEAGQIIPGPVAVFGWDYSRERNITKTPNVEINTLRDGTRHAYKAGEPRRRVRFSWAEGVDVTQLRTEWGGATDPDYVKIAATGTPAALRSDGELLMWGLLDRIDGPGLPVVYIPKIDFSQNGDPSYDPRQYARGAIYGRTMTPVTMETVLGSEEVDEVYRLNSVTIEEEL
jgi:hypothetical protein